MAIDYTLSGATLLDQLAPTTLDGLPNNDANDNCVGTSIAEALHILTGQAFDGDEVKDAVYGAGYIGTESASAYVSYCAAHGVDLRAHDDTQAGLITTLHSAVDAGWPCLVTMPSQWGTAPADPVHPVGSTHVGVAVGTGPGMLRIMNPWHGFYQDESDAWWQARLCYGQVWPMMRRANMGIPAGWTDDGVTLTASPAPDGTRYSCVRGMRDSVVNEPGGHDPSDVPVCEEIGTPIVEYGHQSLGGGVVQFFLKSGQRSWVRGFNNDQVFSTWNGQEEYALRRLLENTLAALKAAQNAPAPAPAPVPAPVDPAIAAKATALDALFACYGVK